MGDELIEKVMSRPLFVRDSDLATKVRSIFRRSGYRSLPVVDRKERLIGIITRRDMLNITSTKSNVTAKGIMSSPIVYLTPDEDLSSGAKKMLRAKVSRAMVVESKQGMKLAGVVSTHDLLKVLFEKRHSPKKLVKEIMNRNVPACSPSDLITKVWRRMEEVSCTGMPVVKKKVIGMITRGDIIAAGFARIHREDEGGKNRTSTVERVMQTPVISIAPEARIEDAAAVMLKKNIGSLPVIEKGMLLGLVDRNDIIKQYLER
ncbi:MAG: CBS domain-containing protein [Candidatus Hydrothermarchaeota archaeon]|nr:CBS domain-containing protein [Candidatus Hydrothermarchaeota archaeon]